MSTNPAVFNFHTSEIRVIIKNSEPWFVCSDVASALGYTTAKDASRNLADHQKGRQIVPTLGGDQTVTLINESGLYRLVLRSRKPEAVAFSDWVTGEVLPMIRKTGSYSAQPTRSAHGTVTLSNVEAFNLYSLLSMTERLLSPTRLAPIEKALRTLGSPWAVDIADLQFELRPRALRLPSLTVRCHEVCQALA
jgi:prophage antirepressor-like protein